MRILKIRFKNLNSLAGEWEIDLTNPAYQTHGLFAITGPTGAGKSTLLDAVCLALYGRTPRLERVNKSGNEIMSRRTGECFAEVTFETQSGVYRCHWSHARARKKPDGELQQPRHEIADGKTGELLETKIREVGERIEAVTGMDFDRFTRSMLLAQGGFAVFLQAPAEERATILEQITGTEIYSDISKRVHLRNAEEKKQLELLHAELKGLQPLTEEEEHALEAAWEEKNTQNAEFVAQQAQLTAQLAWLAGIWKLDTEQTQLLTRQAEQGVQEQAFLPERERLYNANKAMIAAPDASILITLREEQAQDEAHLTETEQQIPTLEAMLASALAAHQEDVQSLGKQQAEMDRLAPVLQQVQGLDVEIREKRLPLEEKQKAVQSLSDLLLANKEAWKQTEEILEEKSSQLKTLTAWLEDTAVDETLVTGLGGLQARLDWILTQQRQLQQKRKERDSAGVARTEAEGTLAAHQASQQALHAQLETLQQEHAQARNALEVSLGGVSLPEYRSRRQTLDTQQLRVKELLQGTRSSAAALIRLETLAGERRTAAEEQTSLQSRIALETERLLGLERETGMLETQVLLLHRITDLTQQRERLEDGKPCPLCGATAHPYAAGNLPQMDGTEQALTQARTRHKEQSATVQSLQIRLATVGKELEHNDRECKTVLRALVDGEVQVREVWEQLETAMDTLCSNDLGFTQFGSYTPITGEVVGMNVVNALDALSHTVCRERETALVALQSALVERVSVVEKLLSEAEAKEKRIAGLRDALDKARAQVVQVDTETQAAGNQLVERQATVTRLDGEAAAFEESLANAVVALEESVGAYVTVPAEGTKKDGAVSRVQWLQTVFPQLLDRQEKWKERQAARLQLSQDQAVLQQRGLQLAEAVTRNEVDRDILTQEMTLQQQALYALEEIRHRLLGEQNAGEVEKSLQQALKSAQAAEKAGLATLTGAQHALESQRKHIQERKTGIAARDEKLHSLREGFLKKINELGFTDEAAWVAAKLPEEERARLQEQGQTLEKDRHAIAERLREVREQLVTEREKALTAVTQEAQEELLTQQADLTARQTALQQEIGALRSQVEQNKQLRVRAAEQLQRFETQRQECERWENLHDLIGSADGKKYRNFAQGLTFEMMIRHANTQLVQLSDRYLLTRNADQPLELLVIDNYQAGEERSTKNLSGGESFLVSLSLALGLSHMASRKVRVDSLFLDEGFGTLDEETLSSALDTLSSLQRDGKLIGVISHVGALKERIPTQIQVSAQTNGRSSLSGPGCKKVW